MFRPPEWDKFCFTWTKENNFLSLQFTYVKGLKKVSIHTFPPGAGFKNFVFFCVCADFRVTVKMFCGPYANC